MGEADAVAQRLLSSPLEAHVECEPQRVPRARLLARHVRAHLPAERVDADLREARPAAEVGVVRGFDPGLPDAVAGAVAVPAQPLQLVGEISPVYPSTWAASDEYG